MANVLLINKKRPISIQMKLSMLSRYTFDVISRYFDPRHAPASVVVNLNALVNNAYKEISHLAHIHMIEESVDEIVEDFWKWSDRKIVTVKEMAKIMGKSVSTIYRWIKQGKLQAQKYKGRWQVIA